MKELLKNKNVSVYYCSKKTGIPYSTLRDLVVRKKKINNCSVGILVKLAIFFNMNLDDFYFYLHQERSINDVANL